MTHLSDVEKQLHDERTATGHQPAPPIGRVRVPSEPTVLHPHRTKSEPQSPSRPIWHKDNYGFWLTVCVVISLVFAIVYRGLA